MLLLFCYGCWCILYLPDAVGVSFSLPGAVFLNVFAVAAASAAVDIYPAFPCTANHITF